jgi:hypothetical protein
MSITALSGSTVRAVNVFYNFEGNPMDPDLVKVRIYDRKYKMEQEFILSDGNKLQTGVYFFDYVTPTEPSQTKIIEFYGEISGNPSIERDTIYTTFIKN